MDFVESKARTVDIAVENALSELGIKKENAIIEVIEEGGLFTEAVVKVSKKESLGDKAIEFLNTLLKKMNLDCTAVLEDKTDDEQIFINLSGTDNGIAIGYRGEILDALQYLTLLAINNGSENFTRVTLNAESYREKRTATLTDLSRKLANKVLRTGRKVELEPMNPFERRVVHTTLQDNPDVVTESFGVEPNRYVVIKPRYSNGGTTSNFRKNGMGRTRSFGQNKRKTF